MGCSLEGLKEEFRKLLVANKFYVGNSDVAKMLRELANEFDD
jgi:hypothetical protein